MDISTDPAAIVETRLAASPDARIAYRTWGDESVVHHALSNDSYRLAEPAGTLLQALLGGAASTSASLAAARGLDPQEVDRTLRTLIELNLVVRC